MDNAQSVPVCYRHKKKETYIRCVRCDRPICPDCMTEAPVGYQCPDCVSEGRKSMRQARSTFGGSVSGANGLATKTLIGINLAVFIATIAVSGVGVFQGGASQLHLAGAMYNAPGYFLVSLFGTEFELSSVSSGGYYRMVTSMFLHFGIMHLAFNMVVLWILGRVLERDLGSARFVALYFVAGLGGSVLTYLFADPQTLSAGASGAIFGLFGALVVINRKLSRDNSGLYILLGLNLAITFIVPNISWTAHIGGLISGAACGAILAFTPRQQRRTVPWILFAALVVVMVMLTLWQTGNLNPSTTTVV
ncbi:rhomboid family intramembrane serine protease [Natronoglycomyces albus]|uniref:Rhomboid family intramembrane serine protease n=1 Tax=Natronoglycomyces albus TaxID=2811108 RepID=A0A895XZ61_9ACTN|nr:rhomboid family intramembrane serine protease [Natronoglycomyces albus]QSB06888.1 rhomboid family intramembrane serine protease [Natronoglycomyces albus]